MIIIGITGNIATGKTTVANYFRKRKIPVFDADTCVAELYFNKKSEIYYYVKRFFSKAVTRSGICR